MIKVSSLTKVAMFSAITAVISQIAIPIGLVPISLGVLAVYLCGIFLEPKLAVLSQVIYIVMGIIGLPVFANASGGIGVLFGPTGGFIISYVVMAYIISYTYHNSTKNNFGSTRLKLAFIIAIITCYIFGIIWFAFVTKMTFVASIVYILNPIIIVGDVIKIIVAISIFVPMEKRFKGYKY